MAINYKLVTATSDASSPDTVFTATAVATHVKSIRIANESGGALTYHLAVYDHSASIEVPITVPATSLPDDDVDVMVEPFNLQNSDYIKLYSSGAGVKVAITLAENTDTAGATTSDDLAQGTTNLYLTSAERTKLSGIATGAEVNQNAFSNVAVTGQDAVAADGKTDTLNLAAGTGITITTNATTDTVTITNSATGANAFGNVAVTGQNTVAADSTNDTLTLVAGTGISITTDDVNDNITITNSVTAPNTFGTIEVSGQSAVVADSTTDTLTLAAANTNVVITTNATTDTVTFGLGTDIVTGSVSVTGALTAIGNVVCDDVIAGGDVSVTGVISADSATLVTLNFTGGGTTSIGPNNALPTDPADLEIRTNGNCDVVLDYDDNESSQAFRVKDGDGNIMFSVDEDGISVANGTASTGAVLRLGEATANGTNYVAVQAAASLAANTTYTLPTADGTSGQLLSTNGSGTLSWATASGGSGSPAGSTGQIQYNNAGAFGAEAALYYDATNNRLSVGGNNIPTGTITSRGAGTTTGTTFLCEDSGGSARFTIYDRGTMFTNERSDISASVHSFVFNATKNEYWRPTIAFKNTTFTSAIAAWLGDTNTLGYFGTLGGTAATGGLGLYGASSGASASNPTWQMQGFHGSTAPTEAIIRLVGTKYAGSGSGSSMLAALANGETILSVINSGTTGGTNVRMAILGSGAMGLRNTAPTSSTSLTVRGHGTTTGTSLLVENSSGTARFTVLDNGAFAFAGGTVTAATTGYTTFTNLTTDRTCDANATTVEELADILGTLIVDLKTKGIIAA
jgi:hypothetical protein